MSEDITSPPRQEHRRENQASIRDIPPFPKGTMSAVSPKAASASSSDPHRDEMIKLLKDQNKILMTMLHQQKEQQDTLLSGFARTSEQNKEMLQELKPEPPSTAEDAKELCEKRLPNDVKKQIQSLFGDVKKEFTKFLKYKEMCDRIDEEIAALEAGRIPNKNKPFKPQFEIRTLDDRADTQREVKIEFQAGTTNRQRLEKLHFQYLIEKKTIEKESLTQIRNHMLNDLKYDAFKTAINSKVLEHDIKMIREFGLDFPEKLMDQNQHLINQWSLQLYDKMVREAKEIRRKQQEKDAKTEERKRKIETEAAMLDPKTKIVYAVKQAMQMEQADKKGSKK